MEEILNATVFMLLNRIVSARVGHLMMSDCVGILAGTSLASGVVVIKVQAAVFSNIR